MRILVSGTGSGLGAYLAYKYKAESFNRASFAKNSKQVIFDKIIHCAFSKFNNENEKDYIQSHVSLCQNLLEIPHKKFIFISSIEAAEINKSPSVYALAKRDVEKIILAKIKNYLIIRPGSLFGPGMKINQILKVALGDPVKLTLSSESNFSIAMYDDLLDAINLDILGVFHLTSLRNITLKEIAKEFNSNPLWGEYKYSTPKVECDIPFEKNSDIKNKDPLHRLSFFINMHKSSF